MKDLHTDKIANFSAVLTKAFELLQQVRDIITNNSVYCVLLPSHPYIIDLSFTAWITLLPED
jgi:hypothetical protein